MSKHHSSDEESDEESFDMKQHKHAASADEDEFEFDQQVTEKKNPLQKTLDKPFDEVHELSSADELSQLSPQSSHRQQQHHSEDDEDEREKMIKAKKAAEKDKKSKKDKKKDKKPAAMAIKPGNVQQSTVKNNNVAAAAELERQQLAGNSTSEEEESDEEETEDEQSNANAGKSTAKLYNPNDYKHLVVSSEIQDLFDYIGRHKAQDIELDTKLKPFIPDFIPAIGEIDAFLKVLIPDETCGKDTLGLLVLDEPAANQSDPTVMDLTLRAVNKQVIHKTVTVGTIEHADKNPKKIQKWIQSIEEVHRKKPPPHVHYSRSMPDIEQLMQAWPTEFEELLKATKLPAAELDVEVADFARMVCAMMDIPVYDKITESLHVLFTLYSEFKQNSHFQH